MIIINYFCSTEKIFEAVRTMNNCYFSIHYIRVKQILLCVVVLVELVVVVLVVVGDIGLVVVTIIPVVV
jgi:hypothetical protein